MIMRRPRNRKRDSAADANSPNRIDRITAPATTITLVRRLSRKPDCVIATTKLWIVGFVGKNTGVDVMISDRGLTAVLTIQ